MNPYIFVSPQPWFDKSYGLYKKSPQSAIVWTSDLQYWTRVGIWHFPMNLIFDNPRLFKTAHHLQMKPVPFAQIFISLPPQIYESSDLHIQIYVSSDLHTSAPWIHRSSDPSISTSMGPQIPESLDLYIHGSSYLYIHALIRQTWRSIRTLWMQGLHVRISR